MTPLYGYNSAEQSYLIPSYPYGRDRCRIRFWLENDKKRGFRFCSQTEHPRKLVWNNPKRSTYMLLGGCMFLDDKEHCTWSGVSEYSKAEDVLQFITNFPKADNVAISSWSLLKITHLHRLTTGQAFFEINGVRQPYSEADKARDTAELLVWRQCLEKLRVGV